MNSKIQQINDLILKLRRASKKVALQRLRNEAKKTESKYQKALEKAVKPWQDQFDKFFTKTKQLELFRKASTFFPNGRNITFIEKSISLDREIVQDLFQNTSIGIPQNIEIEVADIIDQFFGIDVYKAIEVEKIEGDEFVDSSLRGFEFNINVLIETLFAYNILAFNNFGNILVVNAGSTGFYLANTDIIQAIVNRANKLAGNWSDRAFLSLKNRIAKSYFVEGKHPWLRGRGPNGGLLTSIKDDIQHFFDGNVKRAKTVARTETAVMESESTWIFNKRSGIMRHGWAATLDGLTREEHRENHAKVRAIGEPFPNGQLRVGDGTARQVVNCLTYKALIDTPNGKVFIKDINEGDEVYSIVNRKLKIQKVKHKMIGDSTYDWMRIRWNQKCNGHSYRSQILTQDHKIIVDGIKKTVSNCCVGDNIYIPIFKIDGEAKQYILGSLLGDSVLVRTHNNKNQSGYPILNMAQSIKHLGYLNDKARVLGGCLKRKEKRENGVVSLITESMYDLENIWELTRNNGVKKYITREWLNEIDSIGLAAWYMDDGSIERDSAMYIHVTRTENEIEDIIKYFNEVWKVNPIYKLRSFYGGGVTDPNRKYVHGSLRFTVKDSKIIMYAIAKYIHPSMRYKSIKGYKDVEFIESDIVKVGIGKAKIISIEKFKSSRKLNRYNLEINGEHNFMAGLAVSNCRCANYGLPEGVIDPWHGENFETMSQMINLDKLFNLPLEN